jgi:hypothetical protein
MDSKNLPQSVKECFEEKPSKKLPPKPSGVTKRKLSGATKISKDIQNNVSMVTEALTEVANMVDATPVIGDKLKMCSKSLRITSSLLSKLSSVFSKMNCLKKKAKKASPPLSLEEDDEKVTI